MNKLAMLQAPVDPGLVRKPAPDRGFLEGPAVGLRGIQQVPSDAGQHDRVVHLDAPQEIGPDRIAEVELLRGVVASMDRQIESARQRLAAFDWLGSAPSAAAPEYRQEYHSPADSTEATEPDPAWVERHAGWGALRVLASLDELVAAELLDVPALWSEPAERCWCSTCALDEESAVDVDLGEGT